MIVHRAYKYRIYPNLAQKVLLDKHFGCARYVYNYYLRKCMDHYALHKTGLSYNHNAHDLVALKKNLTWLAEVGAQSLQASLKDLEAAYTRFFKGSGFPNFKRKHSKQSFRVTQYFKVAVNHIMLPKLGKIRTKVHRQVGDKLCNITISKTPAGRYYASVACETYIPEPVFEGTRIGVDLGVKDYLVDSNGNRFVNPKWLQKSLAKLQRLQHLLSKKIRGSCKYLRLRAKISRLHEKISNQRTDFLHKLSLQLVRENQVIAVETLNVKNMLMESHHTLARHIQEAAWYQFITYLEYKGKWYGCHINKVDKYFPSSKRCSSCGYIKETLVLDERLWTCPECGIIHDRDLNAARNILAVGTTV